MSFFSFFIFSSVSLLSITLSLSISFHFLSFLSPPTPHRGILSLFILLKQVFLPLIRKVIFYTLFLRSCSTCSFCYCCWWPIDTFTDTLGRYSQWTLIYLVRSSTNTWDYTDNMFCCNWWRLYYFVQVYCLWSLFIFCFGTYKCTVE